jgi:pyrimidine operon attenuation protein/uracil phosphoribosyltransferase
MLGRGIPVLPVSLSRPVFFFTGKIAGVTTDLVSRGKTLSSNEVLDAIAALADKIAARHKAGDKIVLAGIARGGIPLARLLAAELATRSHIATTLANVDVSFHRDDIGHNPIPTEMPPSHFADDVAGATIILVDDVLFSGRTVNAALNEIFDHGRPAKVELAVLVDRGGRRLPIHADYAGITMKVPGDRRVTVRLDENSPENNRIEVAAP